MNDISTHTPTPWRLANHIHIKAENGYRVATVQVPRGSIRENEVTAGDNARFIVKAVNSHEVYEAALEAIADGKYIGGPDAELQCSNIARQALATARGTV